VLQCAASEPMQHYPRGCRVKPNQRLERTPTPCLYALAIREARSNAIDEHATDNNDRNSQSRHYHHS
jgi:hypothetical protein